MTKPRTTPKAGPKAGAKKPGRLFTKGQSGNPRGMKRGTKHRKTLLLAAMSQDDREVIVGKIIRQARNGCRTSQRMIQDRIEPFRKGAPVRFALPPLVTVADVVAAQNAITAAMSAGTLTPSEALEVAGVVELQRRAIETQEIETRLHALEGKFK